MPLTTFIQPVKLPLCVPISPDPVLRFLRSNPGANRGKQAKTSPASFRENCPGTLSDFHPKPFAPGPKLGQLERVNFRLLFAVLTRDKSWQCFYGLCFVALRVPFGPILRFGLFDLEDFGGFEELLGLRGAGKRS